MHEGVKKPASWRWWWGGCSSSRCCPLRISGGKKTQPNGNLTPSPRPVCAHILDMVSLANLFAASSCLRTRPTVPPLLSREAGAVQRGRGCSFMPPLFRLQWILSANHALPVSLQPRPWFPSCTRSAPPWPASRSRGHSLSSPMASSWITSCGTRRR